ncbi:MAG: ABC transporter ATP-binding protein, partial [Rhodospirillales bacterium]|nr:ABC transporter ATP-binding protein [Rhodospirillales bacterium]
GVSLEVGRGEVVALLGRNGAGKSTTLKAAMSLVPVSAGRVLFDRRDITAVPPQDVARLGLGYVPEERRIFTDLTVGENLEVGRRKTRLGAPAWNEAALFRLFPNLAALRQRPSGRISGGEQQMLAIARTLVGNPALLLLDEPSEGLSPLIVGQMAETVRALKAEGLSILLCEQNLRFAEAVSDRAYVMEKGCIRWQGGMAALRTDDEVRRAFLAV